MPTSAPASHHPGDGATFWLTGLPSAGKTTLARAVAGRLDGRRPVEILDGDEVRAALSPELGYSRADRDANVARIGWVAARLARHGVIVLAPVVSPYAAARDRVRDAHAADGVRFYEIHVATPVAVCAQRDAKGLYAQAQAGTLHGLTGADDAYEPPTVPALRLDTTDRPLSDVVEELLDLMRKEDLL